MAFFVVLTRYEGLLTDPQPVPKMGPQGSSLSVFLA
jgi:hypothetical protein